MWWTFCNALPEKPASSGVAYCIQACAPDHTGISANIAEMASIPIRTFFIPEFSLNLETRIGRTAVG
jgi:hypothetical protein